ncbi:MAG: hypothetical protein QW136_08025 [Nitrososphaerales archaeon]
MSERKRSGLLPWYGSVSHVCPELFTPVKEAIVIQVIHWARSSRV